MSRQPVETEQLSLDILSGPPIEPIRVEPASGVIVGRSSACDVQLPDQSVSRRHLSLAARSGRWLIRDLGSRHGTLLNGQSLPDAEVTYLTHGDLLMIGPWTFRVRFGEELVVAEAKVREPRPAAA